MLANQILQNRHHEALGLTRAGARGHDGRTWFIVEQGAPRLYLVDIGPRSLGEYVRRRSRQRFKEFSAKEVLRLKILQLQVGFVPAKGMLEHRRREQAALRPQFGTQALV
ncbi:hypothetical protein D3C75_704020 [compost metagenome]